MTMNGTKVNTPNSSPIFPRNNPINYKITAFKNFLYLVLSSFYKSGPRITLTSPRAFSIFSPLSMSGYGYPHNPPGHGYGGGPPPPQPYASQPPYGQPPSSQPPYGQSPATPPYGAPHYGGAEGGKPPKENKPSYGGGYYGGSEGGSKPPKENNSSYYGGAYYGGAEGGAKPPKENNPSHYGSAYYGGAYYGGAEGGAKPPKENKPSYYGGASHGYGPPPAAGSPFAAVLPSTFPPGTDPSIIACFQVADQDGSGLIDDKELQRALSSYNQSFSLRTVHLLMYLFTDSNSRKIGPKEFVSLYYSLQSWREIFERFDRDRSGKIDASELRDALYSLGFSVSPVVLDLLVSKFDKTGGHNKAIEYDNFIECCLTVKGLTEKFKAKDKALAGTATFSYEDFMLTVLPFLIA